MLRLTPFNYVRATSLSQALNAFAQNEAEASLMGGGTDVLPNIKHRLIRPRFVIGLSTIGEIKGISVDDQGRLRIGAGETLWHIEASDLVRTRYPALTDAVSLISTPQVRRQATIGGNVCLDVRCNYYNQSEHWRRAVGFCMKKDSEICRVAPGSDRCWAVASADSVPVLLAHDAEIRIASIEGERWEPLAGFYRDDGLIPLTLGHGEIVTEIRIPPRRMNVVYSKLRIRQSFDFPLVGAATGVALDANGIVEDARIVLTAVGSHPIEISEAEQALVGQQLTDEVIQAAGEKIFRGVHPMDNTEGAISHRKRMARVYVERALRTIREQTPVYRPAITRSIQNTRAKN